MILSRYLINLEMMGLENKKLLNLMEKCGHFLYHRKGGIKGQRRIMSILAEKGEISQKELLELVSVRSGSLSETVIKMEAKGYIAREKDSEDKRKFIIRLTAEGEAYYNAKRIEIASQNQVLFDALTAEEQSQLEGLLTKLTDYWEESLGANYPPYHNKEV